ncbi:SDR family NAD(P)-dependent oxidoreductase [Spirosoma terrae]|uniref:SDR family oxidoreductase n=1 Tax=Spirosoma terrae TaxID=1968276 RepID=A0A6L9LHV6_9BACT|nr:SDR family oxidoreductase [Spirosoma terrae]NDU96219.1 SDR family oxidoreductase [Spirosoma terrae]
MKKRFLIAGAHGGIGEDLAIRLAKAGNEVIATMRHPDQASDDCRSLVKEIRQLDVTDQNSVAKGLADFSADSPLHGFAYCIGSIDLMPLKSARTENFLRAYELNVLGAVRMLQVLEKSLKAGQGSVVLFSSIAAQSGFANHTVISTAKAAVEGLAKSLAAEWSSYVRVNVIAPSLTDTAIAKPLTSSPTMREAIEKMHPIARLGSASDSAAVAEFLLSPDASWITGQIFPVDGGRSTLRVKG